VQNPEIFFNFGQMFLQSCLVPLYQHMSWRCYGTSVNGLPP